MILVEEAPSGISLFLPEPADLFWSAVVLAIIAVVFYKMVLPPMNKILDERAEKIEGGLAQAAKAQEAAEQALANRQAMMEQAHADAAKARDEAREQGKQIIADSRASAQVEAQRIADAAGRQIDADKQAAAVALRSDVGELATELASKIVGESLADDAAKSRMVDRFLDDLEAHGVGKASPAGGPAV
ncbi:MAG: F0F1 ATP synthase subunit B [Cellulomonadaceae bacterium]|jgi:F-type H+-transporting ATPase subunit b|nr:F0F1 ATP synthase subunit B [Cellulomonadaceae bacterium]